MSQTAYTEMIAMVKKKRLCRYCGEDILDLHHKAMTCMRPECKAKAAFEKKQQMKAAKHRFDEKQKHLKTTKSKISKVSKKYPICGYCHKPIKDGNHYYHDRCLNALLRHSKMRIDGDWLFA